MLEELSIKNFAIIESLTVPFSEGLTVLTGETGAGKSIIIDAIGLLIGGRGSVEYVRHGEKRAEIEGLFYVSSDHPAKDKLIEAGIELEEGMLVLRRDITDQGKSICRINGKLVTLAILREMGQSLVDIHGQHEHQELMQTEKHLFMLDSYAGSDLREARQDYKERYKTFVSWKKKWSQLKESDQDTANRLDFIKYQLNEIEQAELRPGEDEELEKESYVLANSEKLYRSLHEAYESLYGEGRSLDWAGMAVSNIEDAASIDESLQKLLESVNSAYFALEEATYSLREHADSLAFDPERLNDIEKRLDEIRQLKRKYGSSVDEVLEYAAKIEEEIESLDNKDERLEMYEKKMHQSFLDLSADAQTLTDIRVQAGLALAEEVQRELQSLFMKSAQLKVEMTDLSRGQEYQDKHKSVFFNENGRDKVEFLLSTNSGEPLKPLAKVASGGEISRIMLAMKTILSGFQSVTSLIFDEVDTGVSGRVAQAIAEKIYRVSRGSQVLCISHLPQVAAMADNHLYIEKKENDNRVITTVTPLPEQEKIDEIARMISGVEVTELTKENANEILSMAEKMKVLNK
ncbi:DNA replication and repair protein RecN [Sinobaca qinghaiensis]|uniref:DNA repair protein RecN n=1 Tax=Sinobaca qinghaiensis TaxID=342944 RepID=A0A419V3G6_9BACL|nr:DNA repair protein RecN [Sinobaca qinghaiensis]RKD72951.1 DNA replication and repair protein RecN [Sinobaca qinghaiensis]